MTRFQQDLSAPLLSKTNSNKPYVILLPEYINVKSIDKAK